MNNQFPIKTLNQLRPVLIGFRKIKGFTQKDVSERLAVTQQTYARLEANPASASIDRLYKVFSRNNAVIYFPFTLHFPHRDEGGI